MKPSMVLVAQPDHIEWPAVIRVVSFNFEVAAAVTWLLLKPAVAQRIADSDVSRTAFRSRLPPTSVCALVSRLACISGHVPALRRESLLWIRRVPGCITITQARLARGSPSVRTGPANLELIDRFFMMTAGARFC